MPTGNRPITRRAPDRRAKPSAVADRPPAWIKPQLAMLVKEAPDGPDWLHEIKLDGYRMHARLDAGRVQNSDSPGKRLDRQIPCYRRGDCRSAGAERLPRW